MYPLSGGSAVNAGIEYQQRVASWLLVLFYRREDISEYFAGFGPFLIESVEFETDQPIDDLELRSAKARILIQVKRTVALSDLVDSEFGKTFAQFVQAHGPQAGPMDEIYVLATSGGSTHPVRTTLRVILEKLRTNPAVFDPAKLTKKEIEVYETVRRLVDALSQAAFNQPGHTILLSLLQRVHVTLVEVEPGTAGEKAALALLAASGFKSPALIWSYLISHSLTLAKMRGSVSHSYLASSLGKYKAIDVNAPTADDIAAILAPTLLEPENLPAGKDVVLGTLVGGDENQIKIIELFRFEDDGRRRLSYRGDLVSFLNGAQMRLVARFASMSSAEKFVERNIGIFSGKETEIIPADAKLIADVEGSPAAAAHRTRLLEVLKANQHPTNCLHCGNHAFNSKTYFVEIDVAEFPSAVGSVHEKCRRPADRIMGEPLNEEASSFHPIPDFDYPKWAKLLLRGQAVLRERARLAKLEEKPLIAWNEDVRYDAEFRYVLRFETAGGEAVYCYRRGKIERFNKGKAQEGLKLFKEGIKQGQARGNPLAANLDNWMLGTRAFIEKMKEGDEKIDLITDVSIAEYSAVLGKAYDRFDNFYTPCCLVRDAETELPFIIAGALPLISRPLEIESFVANWKANGVDIGAYKLTIVENDMIFDQWMRQTFGDGLAAVYDPWLNGEATPGGIEIVPHREFAEKQKERAETRGCGEVQKENSA